MRTSLVIGLIVALCFFGGVGSAAADSTVNYWDGSSSLAINLGGGEHAFVFFNDLTPAPDIFIHPVNFNANLLQVTLSSFTGFGIYLRFEGFNSGFKQYGVYTCLSPSGQTCNISTVRRGTYFI
jgi:hypothetical protein